MANWRVIIRRLWRRVKNAPYFLKQTFTWKCESCKTCGICYHLSYQATDYIWDKVIGKEECHCLECFLRKAKEKDIFLHNSEIHLIMPNKKLYE